MSKSKAKFNAPGSLCTCDRSVFDLALGSGSPPKVGDAQNQKWNPICAHRRPQMDGDQIPFLAQCNPPERFLHQPYGWFPDDFSRRRRLAECRRGRTAANAVDYRRIVRRLPLQLFWSAGL